MLGISKNKSLSAGWVLLLLASLHFGGSAIAQDYDSLAAKYKNEDAVYVNYTQHLVISNVDGELVANSYSTKEKLFISNLSRTTCNREYIMRSDFHEVDELNAVAMIPDGKGYKKVPCNNFAEVNPDNDNVFYDDNRLYVVLYSGLVKKAVTKTKYAVEHKDLHMLPPFVFEQRLPVDKATFEVTVPKYVNMAFALRGPDTAMISQTKEVKANTITYKFTVANVKAYKDYENVPSAWYYLNQIIPYITSYKLSETNKKVDMLENTDLLYKHLYKYVRNLNMKEDTLLTKTVAEVTKGDTDPAAKAKHIYEWVQKNLHYIAFEKGLEGFVPREAAVVLKRKYGDCKDMTSVLVTMYRKAGLDAYYTWIGTRSLPFTFAETPLPLVNNHMICALKLGGEWVFVDGTHPYIPFSQAPTSIQGKEALIAIDDKNYKIVSVPVASADKNMVIDSTSISFAERKLTGSVKQYYKGADAWTLGYQRMYLKGDDWDKRVRALTMRGSDKYRNTNQHTKTGQTAAKDAAIEAEFEVEDYVQHVGKQYFVNMNLKHTFEDNRIDTAERHVPVYFDNNRKVREVVVLNVPKGYKVAYVPPSAKGSVDGLWSYSISYATDKKKTKVTLTKEYALDTRAAAPQLFAANNRMVDELKKMYKETVVLTAK